MVRTVAGRGGLTINPGLGIGRLAASNSASLRRLARSGSLAAKLKKSCSPKKKRAELLSASIFIGQGQA